MGRFRDSAQDDNEAAIDMSPLIDCVFILLIFFIVTTVFVEETGVEVEPPSAASSSQLEKNSILIALTAEGDVVYGGKSIGFQGVRPTVARLVKSGDEIMPVIIQADRNSKTGDLTRIIGEAELGGAETVSISARN